VGVLVLKTQYNLAWNFFNAHALGNTIFGYWSEWLQRHEDGTHNAEFPAPDEQDEKVRAGLSWDLRPTGFLNQRIILSRSRTRNFIDAANLWKRSVLHGFEGIALDDMLYNITHAAEQIQGSVPGPAVSDVNTQVVGRRLHVSQDDQEDDDWVPEDALPHIRFPSPTGAGTSSWQNASLGTWGRGSRP
jgi:hypothetical protein